jgi:hypothetical protein
MRKDIIDLKEKKDVKIKEQSFENYNEAKNKLKI